MAEGKKRVRRKPGRKLIVGSLAGILIVGGVGAAVYARVNNQDEMSKEISTAQSATAKLGSISNTIVGTGNLELEEAQDLNIPSGIEVEAVMVKSGDYVEKGAVLAEVDKTSVIHAVEEIQEEISELDEQISSCLEDGDADTIVTAVDGRVKLIYAVPDQEVADIMLEQGSLMILSLDGKMAVDIPDASQAVSGDSVTVTLSSGTQVEGSVESCDTSGCTVVLTDDGTLYGDTVTVTDGDGNVWGEGTLYIHQPLEITGTAGIVDTVDVSENQSVSGDTVLLTLEDTVNENEYQELLARREACTQTLKKLLILTKDQKVTAEYSGTVQEVNVSAVNSSVSGSSGTAGSGTSAGGTALAGSSGTKAAQMSYVAGAAKVVPLSFTVEEEAFSSEPEEAAIEEAVIEEAVIEETTGQELCFDIRNGSGSSSTVLGIPAPVTGNIPVTDASAADGSYSASVIWNPASETFAPETDYQALVILSASEGFVFTGASVAGTEIGALSGIQVYDDGKSMEFQIVFPRTAKSDSTDDGQSGDTDSPWENSGESGNGTSDGENGGSSGNTDGQTSGTAQNGDSQINGSGNSQTGTDGSSQSGNGTDGDGSNQTGDGVTGGNTQSGSGTAGSGSGQSGSGTSGSGQSGSGSSGSGSGSSGASQSGGNAGTGSSTSGAAQTADSSESNSQKSSTSEESAYSTDVTAFTVSPDEFMQLSVNVDELDINSLELNQKAVITFDAIEDEEFEGEVTSISNTASVSGGVAKYAVGIKVPKDERMRQGMNASATIVIESKENVVTLPMLALQEKGSKVFVYTSQSEDGTLTGEQEVTTGLSDGSTVEITEGLTEGDVVYYQRTGSTQQNGAGGSGGSERNGDFGGFGGMGQMGESGAGNSRPERSGDSGRFGGKNQPGM